MPEKLNLGTIGTSWITEQFIHATAATQKYRLVAVYSRSLEKAEKMSGGQQEVSLYDDLPMFLANEQLDVVYIASPNSVHFEQARQSLLAGKHIIVEKPAFSNVEELNEILNLAKKQDKYFFEATRTLHEDGFHQVKKRLPTQIVGANLTFMKYSSKYDELKSGSVPNIFSSQYSGGALMDLGIYLLYAAIGWFGRPIDVDYIARKLSTGVDGIGIILLRYPSFDVTMQVGKITNSFLPSEIYGEEKTIIIDGINTISSIKEYNQTTGKTETIVCKNSENPMVEEVENFADVLTNKEDKVLEKHYQGWLKLAKEVHETIAKLKRRADIQFEADQKRK